MSDGDCPNCGNLQAAISQLIAGVGAALALILTELEEPTMTRHQLVIAVKDRLDDVLHSAY